MFSISSYSEMMGNLSSVVNVNQFNLIFCAKTGMVEDDDDPLPIPIPGTPKKA